MSNLDIEIHRIRIKALLDLDLLVRILQLEVVFRKHGRDHDLELEIGEVAPDASATAVGEGDDKFLQVVGLGGVRVVEPALRVEGVGVLEVFLVAVDGEGGHGHDGAGFQVVALHDGALFRDDSR